MPLDLPNGTHRLQASIRSARGATAWSVPAPIVLKRPPRHIIPLPPVAKPGSTASVSVRVLDERGMSVADGTPVIARFEKTGETFEGPCRNGTFTFEVARERAREPFTVSADGLQEHLALPPLAEGASAAFVAVDALTGKPIPHPVIGGGSAGSVIGDERGRVLVPASSRPETLIAIAPGYAPALLDTGAARGAAEAAIVRLSPLFGGALAGRRICLDPGGGGSDPGGRGARSLRGASVNLEVARILRNLLERAGAAVTLTRYGDETISPQERVYAVNRADAELALGIRHETPPPGIDASRCVLYFPGSARGRSIAERLAAALGALAPEGPLAVVEWADVFLQQTACPACEVHCGPIEDASREAAMNDDAWLRLEAERIVTALAGSFGYEGAVPADFAVKVIAAGAPAAGASVDIDRLSVRATDAGGSASFGLVEPGAHLVTVRLADGRSALFARIVRPGETALVLEMP
jgi:N-acetylmuramoyl-L-alanine amidase